MLTFSTSKDAITVNDADPVTIVAWGDSPLVIDANGKTRAFVTTKQTDFTLGNATILNGKGGGDGGAIRSAGALTLDRVAIYDSTAPGNGGALYCQGDIKIISNTFTNNRASNNGGAICADFMGLDSCANIDIRRRHGTRHPSAAPLS